jgi:hypothetical protein
MVKCTFLNDLDDAVIVHTYNGEDFLQWAPYSSVPFAAGETKVVEAFSWSGGVLYLQISFGGEHSLSTKVNGNTTIKASQLLSGTTSSKTPQLIRLRERSVVSECKVKNDTSRRILIVAGSVSPVKGSDGTQDILFQSSFPVDPAETINVRVKYGREVIFVRRNDCPHTIDASVGQLVLVSDLPGSSSNPEEVQVESETKDVQP